MAGILHTKIYCLGLSFCRGFLWFASCLDIMFDDDTHVSSIYITGTFPEKKLTIETIRKMDRI